MSDGELLQKISADLSENTKQTVLLKQAIMGNGVKGLVTRVEDIEEWRHTHPRVCPMEAPANPRRVNMWNIFFGLVAVLVGGGSLLLAVVK